MKTFRLSIMAAATALTLTACASETPADTEVVADEGMATDTMASEAPAGDKNIVALAQTNPQASTLVTAVTAADLGETLSGAGPFTVFAPANSAFAKVDKATLDGLMKPENKAKLGEVLKYHVVAGKVTSADLAKMIADGGGTATVKTMTGELKATMDGDKIVLTDGKGMKSMVTAPDMMASNGVVHSIDTVMMK